MKRYMSSYYAIPEIEIPKPASGGYEGVPTVVSLADVFINPFGYVWNARASCFIL